MKKQELIQLIEYTVRKVLNESAIPEIKQLCDEYSELVEEYLDFEQLLEFDSIIDYIKNEIPGIENKWKLYLKNKSKQNNYSKKDEIDFIYQPDIKKQVLEYLKKQDKTIEKKQNDIFKKLVIKYPILQILDKKLSYNSSIEGIDIYKYGNKWSITTPGYYNDDIDITLKQANEYKKFLRDKGIANKRKEKKYQFVQYD